MHTLTQAYTRCWALQCAGRLLSAKSISNDTLGQAGAAFLARALGQDNLDQLETQMNQTYLSAATIIDRVLRAPAEMERP